MLGAASKGLKLRPWLAARWSDPDSRPCAPLLLGRSFTFYFMFLLVPTIDAYYKEFKEYIKITKKEDKSHKKSYHEESHEVLR